MKMKITTSFFRIFLVAFLLSGGCMLPAVWAESTTTECISIGWPSDRSDLQPDPEVHRGMLENGLRYIFYPNNKPENRVAMYLNIQAGSLNEKDEQRGVAHFLEHMLFNGTEHYGPGELIDFFQSIGMSFGGDTNAHTSFDETVYKLNLPDGSEKLLRDGLQVVADYAGGALLLEEEVDRERGIILEEKRARDSESYRAYVDYNRFLMAGTLMPRRMVIGEEAVIASADRKLLKSYYDAWYRPDNMILVMVGNFEIAMAEQLVKEYFSGLSPRSETFTCPDFGKIEHQGVKSFYQHVPEMGKTTVSIQALWNAEQENDSRAFQVSRLYEYATILLMNKRLQKMLEQEEPPFTDSGFFTGDMLHRVRYSAIAATANGNDWKSTLKAVDSALRQALEYGFLESELEIVKKEIIASLEAGVRTRKNRKSQDIARDIIRSINDNRVFQSPEQELELFGDIVRTMQVNDINHTFRSSWKANNRLVSVRGTARIDEENADRFLSEYYHKLKSGQVAPHVELGRGTFPYLEVDKEQYDAGSRIVLDKVDAERVILQNNVAVTYKKTDYEPNRVKVVVDIGTGRFYEPKVGMGVLAEKVFNESGTGRLSRSELSDLLSGSTVNVAFQVREDSFRISGSSLHRDFELLVQLIHTLMMDPDLKKTMYQRSLEQIDQMYRRWETDISGPLNGEVERFLSGGDVKAGYPPKESFAQFTFQELREWFLEEMRTGSVEVTILGDIETDEAKRGSLPYFSRVGERDEITAISAERTFPEGRSLVSAVETQIDKSAVIAAWPTTGMQDIHVVRRLNLLAGVFQERVRKIIREQLGASYSPVVYNQPGTVYPKYGRFVARVTAAPEDTAGILAELAAIAMDLKENGISDVELEQVKKPLITSLKDSVRSNSYWLNSVLVQSVRYPEKLEWSSTMQDDYQVATSEEVNELAAKYLINERMARVVVRPTETEETEGE